MQVSIVASDVKPSDVCDVTICVRQIAQARQCTGVKSFNCPWVVCSARVMYVVLFAACYDMIVCHVFVPTPLIREQIHMKMSFMMLGTKMADRKERTHFVISL